MGLGAARRDGLKAGLVLAWGGGATLGEVAPLRSITGAGGADRAQALKPSTRPRARSTDGFPIPACIIVAARLVECSAALNGHAFLPPGWQKILIAHQGHETHGAKAFLGDLVTAFSVAPKVLVHGGLADGRHQDATVGKLVE